MIKKCLSSFVALALFMGVSAITLADTPLVGTLMINQNNAVGTVGVVGGGSTGTVGGNTYSETTATPGVYTITVTAPAGFVLDSVKDGANVVLASPYTQTLAAGAIITFNVNYVAAPVVPPVTPPAVTEITQQMIKDKTALCAAMKGGKAKLACMKERNQMKRDFQKQEKAKREAARKLDTDKDGVPDIRDAFPTDPKEWKDANHNGIGDNADKAAKDAAKVAQKAAKDAIAAKAAECGKLAVGADKDKCLADLAVLKKAFSDTYGKKTQGDSNFGQKKEEDRQGNDHGNKKGND